MSKLQSLVKVAEEEREKSICRKCQKEYGFEDLVNYIFQNTPSRNLLESTLPKHFSDDQLRMKLCGECRLNTPPCKGCFGCSGIGNQTICPNCLYYGFNHPFSAEGKCSYCCEHPNVSPLTWFYQ